MTRGSLNREDPVFIAYSMNSQPPVFFSGKLLSLQCNFHLWDQTLKFRRESKLLVR